MPHASAMSLSDVRKPDDANIVAAVSKISSRRAPSADISRNRSELARGSADAELRADPEHFVEDRSGNRVRLGCRDLIEMIGDVLRGRSAPEVGNPAVAESDEHARKATCACGE